MASTSLYTLAEIAAVVAENYGADDDITLARAKKWVNRALMRINEMGDWSWLMAFDATFSTVASTESYVLGAGVKKIYSVSLNIGSARRKLRLIDDRKFRDLFAYNTTTTGTPSWYRLFGRDASTGRRKVALFPIPSSVVSVYYDYRKEITLLTNDSDDVRATTGMPDHMIDALIELATAISYRQLDDSDYANAMAEAVARWRTLLAEDLNEIDDTIRMRGFDMDASMFGDPVLPPQYSWD